ncbi:MAG: 30S ribosomal protein S17 [Sedimentisphaerales bacterium]|nr:30S ribosomal protein S17 [Sedimentisphaerales bacterium]
MQRKLVGTVVKKSGAKTIKVVVERKVKHPKYEKYMLRSTKLAVHDPKELACEGDQVEIVPCRPISKTKSWRLSRIVQKAVART